jgi:hypothetical protein
MARIMAAPRRSSRQHFGWSEDAETRNQLLIPDEPRSPLARFGSHQVFPERQQAVIADGLLQRDVFDQEPFQPAYGPAFAYGTGLRSSTGKSDDVAHGCPQAPSHPHPVLVEIQAQLLSLVRQKKPIERRGPLGPHAAKLNAVYAKIPITGGSRPAVTETDASRRASLPGLFIAGLHRPIPIDIVDKSG